MAVGVNLNMATLTALYQSRRLLIDGRILPAVPFKLNSAESKFALPNNPAVHEFLKED